MDFLKKTKETFKSAGSTISQKASGVSSTVQITMKIKEEEKSLKELQAEVSRVMLEEHYDELQKLCPDLLKRIEDTKAQIEKDRVELALAKGLQVCPNCGSEEEADTLCCTKCGTNIKEAVAYMKEMEAAEQAAAAQAAAEKAMAEQAQTVPEAVAEEAPAVFCPNCGAKVSPNMSFCSTCGNKLSE